MLDYTAQEIDLAQAAQLAAPQSVFHAWAAAQTEADKIITAWQSEPVTLPWTRVQLASYVKHKMMPTRGARGLALVHVAMHDAYLLAQGRNGIRLQWYGEGRYYGPGSWVATPPYFYFPPDEPFAHGWKTWVLCRLAGIAQHNCRQQGGAGGHCQVLGRWPWLGNTARALEPDCHEPGAENQAR